MWRFSKVRLRQGERTKNLASWKNWLNDEADKGCRHAHQYTRLPESWKPVEVRTAEGALSADPIELMNAERRKFKQLWCADDAATSKVGGTKTPSDEGHPRLAKHSASQLRLAAKSFSIKTSSTFDGFHPRHFDCLSDPALTTFALI